MSETANLSRFADSTVADAHEALSDVRRRRLVAALRELDPDGVGVVRVPDDVPAGRKGRHAFEIELYHVHLPKLEAAGFVEWDGRSQVTRGPKFDVIEEVLEAFDGVDDGA